MTIVEFLEARLAEDEGWARDTEAQRERDAEVGRFTVRRWLPAFPGKPYRDPWPLPGEPKLVLREVAAKRALLEIHCNGNPDSSSAHYCQTCHDYYDHDAESWPCQSARMLVAIYSDHPDFQREWVEE